MKFKDYLSGNVAVFEISGRLMGGRDATLFNGRVREYVNLNKNRVLIDLAGVRWTNSSGLGMLLGAYKTIHEVGGRLALTSVEQIQSLLVVSRLATVIEHYENRDEALRNLQA